MLKIAVCAKQVPDTDIPPSQFKVDEVELRVIPPAGCTADREWVRHECGGGGVAVAGCWC